MHVIKNEDGFSMAFNPEDVMFISLSPYNSELLSDGDKLFLTVALDIHGKIENTYVSFNSIKKANCELEKLISTIRERNEVIKQEEKDASDRYDGLCAKYADRGDL